MWLFPHCSVYFETARHLFSSILFEEGGPFWILSVSMLHYCFNNSIINDFQKD